MNTLLIVEPRKMIEIIPLVIKNFYDKINWKVVFYCGKDLKNFWETSNLINIPKEMLDIRELETNNLTPDQYNDLFKTKTFWESLNGEYILVFQSDTWCFNDSQYNINYFINKKYSYLGGNGRIRGKQVTWKMAYHKYLEKIKKGHDYNNNNGGLSLRNRQHMIDIIEKFPPKKSVSTLISTSFEDLAEDVYFPIGCYLLNYKVGDNKSDDACFALHLAYYKEAFGLHKITYEVYIKLLPKYPELLKIAKYICFDKKYRIINDT